MDWFMLTVMVIAGWAVLSMLATERMNRQHQLAATAAATAADPLPVDAPPARAAA